MAAETLGPTRWELRKYKGMTYLKYAEYRKILNYVNMKWLNICWS